MMVMEEVVAKKVFSREWIVVLIESQMDVVTLNLLPSSWGILGMP